MHHTMRNLFCYSSAFQPSFRHYDPGVPQLLNFNNKKNMLHSIPKMYFFIIGILKKFSREFSIRLNVIY